MLLELVTDDSGRVLAHHVTTAQTDYAVEVGDWTVLVDTTLSSDREPLIATHAAQLCTRLQDGAPLDRAFFEQLFGGHFVAVALHKPSGHLHVLRDVAGAKSVYVSQRPRSVIVGTTMHAIAARIEARTLSRSAALHTMTLDYLFDGETYYAGIDEIPMGSRVTLAPGARLEVAQRFDLDLAEEENGRDFASNVQALREGIIEAHALRAGPENVVLLSGGIDSSVMLCALREVVDRSRVRAITFRVKGTGQDETGYAFALAQHLSVPIERVEIDPFDPRIEDTFEQDVLRMNSPYVGRFIFGQFKANRNEVYFAGQDTRLHTPDLNGLDKVAFAGLPLQRNPLARPVGKLLAKAAGPLSALGASTSQSRLARGMFRASLTMDLDQYLPRFFFKLNREKLRASGFNEQMIEEAHARVRVPWTEARNHRHLYNMIVAAKWGEQYTDDMRYLQDLAFANGTYMALPFYDIKLARMSSALPFEQASRFMIGRGKFGNERVVINKAMLRETFKKELNEELYLRAKAVSSSQYLLFSGTLGKVITRLLKDDRARGAASIATALGLDQLVTHFLSLTQYRPDDEVFLTKVYWLGVLTLIGRNRHVG